MQVQITGKHTEITAGLRNYVTSKLERLEDYYPKVKKVSVILTVEKYRHTAEIHFHAEGVEMSAKKTTKDMYASIEEALAAIEHQAAKRKDRLRSQNAQRKGAAKGKKGASRKAELEAEEAPKPKIVRSKAKALKPMRVEDAISALESGGQAFLLFKDAESGDTQLLFKRDDGNYGLMEA
jgi:putative sigma-54 modulation protein